MELLPNIQMNCVVNENEILHSFVYNKNTMPQKIPLL